MAANSFYQGFTKIAHLASETKGSNKLLGLCCHLSYIVAISLTFMTVRDFALFAFVACF